MDRVLTMMTTMMTMIIARDGVIWMEEGENRV
jgi:hypothetical protein